MSVDGHGVGLAVEHVSSLQNIEGVLTLVEEEAHGTPLHGDPENVEGVLAYVETLLLFVTFFTFTSDLILSCVLYFCIFEYLQKYILVSYS